MFFKFLDAFCITDIYKAGSIRMLHRGLLWYNIT